MWERDTSVFSKSKQQDLNKQISDLEKDIRKDDLNSQIEDLENQKQAEEDSYEEQIKSKKEYYAEQKKIQEKANDEALLEQKAYAKADKLLKEKHMTDIIQIMQNHAENFKEVGALLGENFAEELTSKVQQACSAVDSLLGQYDVPYSENLNSPDLEGTVIKKIKKGGSKPLKQFKMASASSGGRTPSGIDEGRMMILHSDEMISSAEDTKKFDNINRVVNETKEILNKLTNSLNGFNMNSLSNALGLNYLNPAMSLTNLSNSTSNTNDDYTDIKMINNIYNTNALETGINERQIEKKLDKIMRKQGRKFK